MNRIINIAILGAGRIGRLHAEVCNKIKNVDIVAIVDLDEEKGKDLASLCEAKFYKNLDELLINENLDVVAVCTPTFTHLEAVKKIAKAGVNIFCEKPLALSLEEADLMINFIKKNKVKAIVAHVLRFWPEYCKAKEMIDNKVFGKISHIQCERLCAIQNCDKGSWKTNEEESGGAALDLQIHDLDYLIWIFGEPTFLASSGVYNKNLGGWSHINTLLKFENNVSGFINAGWDLVEGFPFTMILRVICEYGVIEWIYRSIKGYKGRDKKFPLTIYKSDGSNYVEKVGTADPYFREWEYFIDCIINNKQVQNSTFENARLSLSYTLKTMQL